MNEMPTVASLSKPPRRGVDAEALLASLAPVVAKPDTPAPAPQPRSEPKAEVKTESASAAEVTQPRKLKPRKPTVEKPVTKAIDEDEDELTDEPRQKGIKASANRAKLDVEINPGEGSTAIYVRVPRTTHLALKLLALQNQAVMDGPTELASIVRTAIDEYLAKQNRAARKAA